MAMKFRKKSSEAGNANMKKKVEQDSVEIVESTFAVSNF